MYTYRHTVKTNCKFCGKVFDSFKLSKICPDCDAHMEDYFKRINEYLEKFPEATSAEISEALELHTPIVMNFFKERRLSTRSRKCEMCGRPIASGRYCFNCGIKVTSSEMSRGSLSKV